MFQVNNKDTRTTHISHLVLVFLLLTLNMQLPTGYFSKHPPISCFKNLWKLPGKRFMVEFFLKTFDFSIFPENFFRAAMPCFCRNELHSRRYFWSFTDFQKHARMKDIVLKLPVYIKRAPLQSFSWQFFKIFKIY